MGPAAFAAVAASAYAAHQVGDYWVQTGYQAMVKGEPNWAGRWACALHVWSYTLTLYAFLIIMSAWTGLRLDPWWVLGGVELSAVTHYFSDRRKLLERLAGLLGSRGFYRAGEGLASGAAYLDQAWHWYWLFFSALIIAGPPH
jgi:hypothetical protein